MEKAQRVVGRGLCRLPGAHLPCVWGAHCSTGSLLKPWHQAAGTHTTTPWEEGGFSPHPVLAAGTTRQGKGPSSAEDVFMAVQATLLQHSHTSALFMIG